MLNMRRFTQSPPPPSTRSRAARYDIDGDEIHYPTRPVDKDKAEQELTINIKKAASPEETAPKQKHVRSEYNFGDESCVHILSRMHRIYLGLSLINIYLARTSCATYPLR